MAIGKFLEKRFKNKEVELLVDHDAEWIQYSQASVVNGMVLHAIFVGYDVDCEIITMKCIHNDDYFYISESFIQMFWEPGVKISEVAKTVLNTGKKLFKGNDIF